MDDIDATDPEPLPESSTPEETKRYNEEVKEYCTEMYEWFCDSKFEGEALWIELTTTFRSHTIKNMTKTMLLNWIEFLISRGVYVKRGKGIRRDSALIECLQSDSFVPTASGSSSTATISKVKKISQHKMSPQMTRYKKRRRAKEIKFQMKITS